MFRLSHDIDWMNIPCVLVSNHKVTTFCLNIKKKSSEKIRCLHNLCQ